MVVKLVCASTRIVVRFVIQIINADAIEKYFIKFVVELLING